MTSCCAWKCVGVISGALLQLRSEFSLNCQQTELVVSALLIGALVASFSGGLCMHVFVSRMGKTYTVKTTAQVLKSV